MTTGNYRGLDLSTLAVVAGAGVVLVAAAVASFRAATR
jgi:hypothetical protein